MEEKRYVFLFVLFLSYFLLYKKIPKYNIPRRELLLCLVQALVVAIMLGRIARSLVDGQKLSFSLLVSVLVVPKHTWYGGLVGAGLVLWYWVRKWNLNSPWKILDEFSFLSPLVYSILRLNCFIEGHCYGTPSTLPWAILFPNPKVPIHPVQLYDSYLNFCLFLVLPELDKKKIFDGQITLQFLIFHSLIRFFVEYFRWGVSAVVVGGVITQAQIASLVIIAGSLVAWRVLAKQARGGRGRAVIRCQMSVDG